MAIAAGIGYGVVHSQIFLKGEVEGTYSALQQNRNLIPVSITSWLVIIITDLIVSWSLYNFLKSSSQIKASIVSILRLAYTFFLIAAVAQLFTAYTSDEPNAIYNYFLGFEKIWYCGLILFGVHLYYLGRTTCYSKLIPKFWSGLLVLSGLSYIVINVGELWFETASWLRITKQILSIPMAISELGLAIWLIVKFWKK